jgi:pimeloyl-ACP methyl ester carboxylesterase
MIMLAKSGLAVALLLSCTGGVASQCEYAIEKVEYKTLVANLYLPQTDHKTPVVIAFGGSEGGISSGDASGEMLAPRCIAVLALAYFNAAGLPPTLDHIPLEYFIDAIDYLSGVQALDAAKIGIVSGSRGSEAALLVASMDARIKSVVVATPSSVAWYGRTTEASAWTYRGRDIAALTVHDDASLPQVRRFEVALDGVKDRDDYAIHIERINGPVFFISAENDEIWPSLRMSNEMVNYLKAHNFKFQVRHDSYPTGHGFSKDVAPLIKQSVVDRFLDTL